MVWRARAEHASSLGRPCAAGPASGAADDVLLHAKCKNRCAPVRAPGTLVMVAAPDPRPKGALQFETGEPPRLFPAADRSKVGMIVDNRKMAHNTTAGLTAPYVLRRLLKATGGLLTP